MPATKLLLITVIVSICIHVSASNNLMLANNNKSNYEIIIRANAPRDTKFAAGELKHYIKKVTGADIPVKTTLSAGRKAIYIGGNSSLPNKPEFDPKNYSNEEKFLIERVGENIVIMGGESNVNPDGPIRNSHSDGVNLGQLFGVYEFIERFLGVRWYAPGELGECFEKLNNIEVNNLPVKQHAEYTSRSYWPTVFYESSQKEGYLWFRRLRGGGMKPFSPNHSLMKWTIPYRESYPEIFALKADGTRNFGVYNTPAWNRLPHFCYSNPDTLKVYLEMIDEYYKGTKKGKSWIRCRPTKNFIYFVPNDNFRTSYCRCKNCLALTDFSKGDKGFQSKLVLGFAAKLAEKIKEKYPDKVLGTLAYEGYFILPEEIKFPGNVAVNICINPYIIYFGLPEYEKRIEATLDNWKRQTLFIGAFQYYLPYKPIPFMMPHILVDWHRKHAAFLKSNFINLEIPRTRRWPIKMATKHTDTFFKGTNLAQTYLNLFFSMKSQWGGDFNVDAELEKYYKLFFGPARIPMKKFHELAIKRWENVNVTPRPKTDPYIAFTNNDIYGNIYNPKVAATLKKLYEEALSLAPAGSIYRKRLEWIKLSYWGEFLKISDAYAKENGERWMVGSLLESGKPVIKEFVDNKTWQTIPSHKLQSTNGPVPAGFSTGFKLAVSGNTLFMKISGDDPDWKSQKLICRGKDSPVYSDDSIEIFIIPDADKPERFFQIAINLNDVAFDRKVSEKLKDITWQSGVKSRTTKQKGKWLMEIALPLEQLDIDKVKPGDIWRFNLCRNKYSGIGENHERSQWTPTGGNYQTTKLCGKIIFAAPGEFVENFSGNLAKDCAFGFNHCVSTPEGKTKKLPNAEEKKRNTSIIKNGVLEWSVNFPTDKKRLRKNYAYLTFRKAGDIDITGSQWCEIKFLNPNSDVSLTLVYGYIGTDGKKYADYCKISNKDGSSKWMVKTIDFTKDGVRAVKQRMNGGKFAPPEKLLYLQIYANCYPEKDGAMRTVDFDYIRITGHPFAHAKK